MFSAHPRTLSKEEYKVTPTPPVITLPPDEILVSGGLVQELTDWCLWNREPWEIIKIKRNPDGSFFGMFSDPEHGGTSHQGTIQEVALALHRSVAEPIIAIFEMKDATEKKILDVGFANYRITVTA